MNRANPAVAAGHDEHVTQDFESAVRSMQGGAQERAIGRCAQRHAGGLNGCASDSGALSRNVAEFREMNTSTQIVAT